MDFVLENTFDEKANRWLVSISGEIDIFNSAIFKSSLVDLILDKKVDVEINCKNLEYVDSTGLGALVGVLKSVKAYDGGVYLTNVRANLLKLLKITNLDKVFIIEGGVYGE